MVPVTRASWALHRLLPLRTRLLRYSDPRALHRGQKIGTLPRFHRSWFACDLASLRRAGNEPIQDSYRAYAKWDRMQYLLEKADIWVLGGVKAISTSLISIFGATIAYMLTTSIHAFHLLFAIHNACRDSRRPP